jgi:hypothetical protein
VDFSGSKNRERFQVRVTQSARALMGVFWEIPKSRIKLGRCPEAQRVKKSRNIGQARTWPSRGSWGVFAAYVKDDDAEKVAPLLQSESMYGVLEGIRRDLPCR